MNQPLLVCDTEERRNEIRRHDDFNGLDYLEVVNPVTLKIYFLKKAPEGLQARNVRISGGRRVENQDIRVTAIEICRQEGPDMDDCLVVRLDKTGDFSTYTLCLVALDENGRPTNDPYPGFDPRYHCLDFNFKVDCPSDLDCQDEAICPPEPLEEPEINYLAKDYASFRQLILDRLALTMPDWKERHVPDIGITLVELLAYAGDQLSYYQDAVATEAYLATARQRISVRRHVCLVDYPMHEGCNARAWLHIDTDTDAELEREKIAFVTGYNDALPVDGRILTWDDLRETPASAYEVFEPLPFGPEQTIQLYQAHNEIHLYTWGDLDCCLPKGTTWATLVDGDAVTWPPEPVEDAGQKPRKRKYKEETTPTLEELIAANRVLNLKPGDVIIFEEVIGPKTGLAVDADRRHRHAVRLTKVEPVVDELYRQPLLEIAWDEVDALPFALCLSAVGPPPVCERVFNISVARGNVILVDHGRTVDCETLGVVPIGETAVTCETCHGDPRPSDVRQIPGRFRPTLEQRPVTFSQPLPGLALSEVEVAGPAALLLAQDPRQAVPRITPRSGLGLTCDAEEQIAATTWLAQRDLLASDHDDPHFVAEMDNDGRAHLRFGDGELGMQPGAGEGFTAVYRVGNGSAGNVGAETISHIVTDELISGVNLQPRNPLPAVGGVDPEPLDEVKLFAPYEFRSRLERAITADDYAQIVMRDFAPKVQRAAATLRWTGSWYEVLVAVDALGQVPPDTALLDEIRGHLYRYRRIGHDMVVKPAEYVPLDIELLICVQPNFLRGHVKAALLNRLGNRRQTDGQPGFFHPDNLTFGEGVYLSQLVAAAQAVPGVASVVVKKFERLYEGPNGELETAVLPFGPLEIARLDNDPSFPENGRLKLIMEGGR